MPKPTANSVIDDIAEAVQAGLEFAARKGDFAADVLRCEVLIKTIDLLL